MYDVSYNFKKKCRQNIRDYKDFTITNVTDNETYGTNEINEVEIEGIAYSNYQIIGRAIAREITIQFANQDHDLENKEISLKTTIDNEDLPFGNFLIDRHSFSEVSNVSTARGYDYMIKFDVDYTDENLTYPCTIQDVLNDLCTQVGVTNSSTSIINGSLQVTGNNFTNGENCREVLEQIAQVSGGFAIITRDNELKIVELKNNQVVENLKPSQYLKDMQDKRLYGPINKIVIAMDEDVEGENAFIEDDDSIRANGIQTLQIADNYFLSGSTEIRETALNNLWAELYGLTYKPMSCSYLGFPYLDMGDNINVIIGNETYETFVFNYTIRLNGGYFGTLETPTITRTQEQYQQTNTLANRFQRVEINVDKANGQIESVVTAIGDTSQLNGTSIVQNLSNVNVSVYGNGTPGSGLEARMSSAETNINDNATNIGTALDTSNDALELAEQVQDDTDKLVKNFIFNENGLTIQNDGSTTDDMKLRLDNALLEFLYNNHAILTINGNKIEFTNGSFEKLDLGHFKWVAEGNGSLSLIWEN